MSEYPVFDDVNLRFRLKDKSKQELLDKLSSNTEKSFEQALTEQFKDVNLSNESYIKVEFGNTISKVDKSITIEYEFSILVNSKDVEQYEIYERHSWNRYPQTTPPTDVLMRVEGRLIDPTNMYNSSSRSAIDYRCMKYDGKNWVSYLGYSDPYFKVERFRPWAY